MNEQAETLNPVITQPISPRVLDAIMRPARYSRPWGQSVTFVLILTGSLTLIADWLFYRQPVGWSTALFGAALVIAIILRSRARFLRSSHAGLLIVAYAGLLIALISQPGPLVVIMSFLTISALAMTARGVRGTVRDWAVFLSKGWLRWIHDARTVRRRRRTHSGSTFFKHLAAGAGQWFLPLLLTGFFLALFTIANPIISHWGALLEQAINRGVNDFHPNVGRSIFWAFCAAIIWSFFRIKRHAVLAVRPAFETADRHPHPDFLFRSVMLFNILFAIQSILDLTYLWGGATLPDGMTYASYAHRGAYPLIATALLAGIFVLVTFRPETPTREMRNARRLVCLWLAQNVLLCASSIWRLKLYVEVYGLTRWRVAAFIWMGLVGVGLIWTAMRIVAGKTNAWLVKLNLATTILVMYTLCFVNIEGWIARYNVSHSREMSGSGVSLDLEYLRSLGPESIPATEWLAERTGSSPLGQAARLQNEQLRNHLQQEMVNWRAWTWRRSRLMQKPG